MNDEELHDRAQAILDEAEDSGLYIDRTMDLPFLTAEAYIQALDAIQALAKEHAG